MGKIKKYLILRSSTSRPPVGRSPITNWAAPSLADYFKIRIWSTLCDNGYCILVKELLITSCNTTALTANPLSFSSMVNVTIFTVTPVIFLIQSRVKSKSSAARHSNAGQLRYDAAVCGRNFIKFWSYVNVGNLS